MTTLSSPLRRITRGVFMVWFSHPAWAIAFPPLRGGYGWGIARSAIRHKEICCRMDGAPRHTPPRSPSASRPFPEGREDRRYFTNPSVRGSHSVSSGMSVIAMREARSGRSQGRIAMVVRSTDIFEIRASTNSTMPSGG
jgi:hypothetical protein